MTFGLSSLKHAVSSYNLPFLVIDLLPVLNLNHEKNEKEEREKQVTSPKRNAAK